MIQFSPKQKENWQKTMKEYHRWNISTGARRSGKTFLDYMKIPRRIRYLEDNKLAGEVFIIGFTNQTIETNVLNPLRDMYGDLYVGKVSSDNKINLFGRQCRVVGAHDATRKNVVRGNSWAYCYGDEVATWHKEVFDVAIACLDKPYSVFDGTCNPEAPTHWFKEFLDKALSADPEKRLDLVHTTFKLDENLFLPEETKRNIKNAYAGTVYYDRYVNGLWVAAEGLIYPRFNPAFHVVKTEPRDYSAFWISCDYGTKNAFVLQLWGYCPADMVYYCVDEFYHDGRRDGAKDDSDYYQDLLGLIDRHKDLHVRARFEHLICDPAASNFIEYVWKRGQVKIWSAGSKRGAKNSVLPGIRAVNLALNKGLIKFNDCCKETIKEFGGYLWDDSCEEERPLKVNDHACITGDTLIRTVDGDFHISELVDKTGKALSYDKDGGVFVYNDFYDVSLTRKDAEVYEIELENGTKIKATADHKFMTDSSMKPLKEITRWDKIMVVSEAPHFVGVKGIKEAGRADVYNMTVANTHNYAANGAVISNCDAMRYFVFTQNIINEKAILMA